jgi:hypothetical protein
MILAHLFGIRGHFGDGGTLLLFLLLAGVLIIALLRPGKTEPK